LQTPEVIRVPVFDGITPVRALELAFRNTLHLLFSPFEARRWIKLSVVCLFLGGGTSSAAFHWSLGTLPAEVGFREAVSDLIDFISGNLFLMVSLFLVGLGLSLVLFYLRAVFRFVLIDSFVRKEVLVRKAARDLRRPAHSYFLWLLGILVVAGALLGTGALLALPHMRTAAASSGTGSAGFVALLAVFFLAEIAIGLLVALVVALTDDLVAPVMYAEKKRFPAAWRAVWGHFRAEPRTFGLYVLIRFAIAVVVGAAVLLFLFPALVAVFSGAIISSALVVLTLRLVGVAWVWNPLTLFLASLGLLLLMSALLLLMSVVGMPGQVFLQGMGVRFIGSRVPSLGAMLKDASSK
jgi:hypothetical protein